MRKRVEARERDEAQEKRESEREREKMTDPRESKTAIQGMEREQKDRIESLWSPGPCSSVVSFQTTVVSHAVTRALADAHIWAQIAEKND